MHARVCIIRGAKEATARTCPLGWTALPRQRVWPTPPYVKEPTNMMAQTRRDKGPWRKHGQFISGKGKGGVRRVRGRRRRVVMRKYCPSEPNEEPCGGV